MFFDADGNVYDDEYFFTFQDGGNLDDLQIAPEFLAKVKKLEQTQKEATCVRETRAMLCSIYGCWDRDLDSLITEQLRNL
jgi:hypothetical protein